VRAVLVMAVSDKRAAVHGIALLGNIAIRVARPITGS
jgi:hypothetical protein